MIMNSHESDVDFYTSFMKNHAERLLVEKAKRNTDLHEAKKLEKLEMSMKLEKGSRKREVAKQLEAKKSLNEETQREITKLQEHQHQMSGIENIKKIQQRRPANIDRLTLQTQHVIQKNRNAAESHTKWLKMVDSANIVDELIRTRGQEFLGIDTENKFTKIMKESITKFQRKNWRSKVGKVGVPIILKTGLGLETSREGSGGKSPQKSPISPIRSPARSFPKGKTFPESGIDTLNIDGQDGGSKKKFYR
jgi:hypothetical protein